MQQSQHCWQEPFALLEPARRTQPGACWHTHTHRSIMILHISFTIRRLAAAFIVGSHLDGDEFFSCLAHQA